jgi:hypothetical protein
MILLASSCQKISHISSSISRRSVRYFQQPRLTTPVIFPNSWAPFSRKSGPSKIHTNTVITIIHVLYSISIRSVPFWEIIKLSSFFAARSNFAKAKGTALRRYVAVLLLDDGGHDGRQGRPLSPEDRCCWADCCGHRLQVECLKNLQHFANFNITSCYCTVV